MPQKKQIKLDKNISEILIVNNKKLSPYIETINETSRNIDRRHLGTILGIFEIKDTSEDSAYIVNFLASVAKKTYFSGKRKTASDSFELTLSRINLSLSELARHGNVNWIGKIDAVLCVIGDNQIHFSVSGDAKILLLRDGKLVEISKDLSPKDEANNPVKTFTDIASGKIQNGDRIILTTDDISHIFTIPELEEYTLSFSGKKFVRFLKTALINELEIAGTIVADISEKKLFAKKTPAISVSSKKELNAFSNKTFEEIKKEKEKFKKKNQEINEKEIKEKEKDILTEKPGHIYLKETEEISAENQDNKLKDLVILLQEKFFALVLWFKNRYLDKGCYIIKKRLLPKIISLPGTTFFFAKKIFVKLFQKIKPQKTKDVLLQKTSQMTIVTKNVVLRPIKQTKEKVPINKEKEIEKKEEFSKKQSGNKLSLRNFQKPNFKNSIIIRSVSLFSRKVVLNIKDGRCHKRFSFLKKILPNPKKIIRLYKQLSFKQKVSALIVLSVIIIAPLFFNKKTTDKKYVSKQDIVSDTSGTKTNLPKTEQRESVADNLLWHSNEKVNGVFSFKGSVFVTTDNSLIKINNQEKIFGFPDNFQNPKANSFMSDLNLLFLIDNEKNLFSFSPISRKFKKDTIEIPADAEITAIGTYLTYIYLLDKKNNQIYRYPRAEDGFGERKNWLKDNIDLQNISSMAIDGDIFLLNSDEKEIIKLTKGKRQPFNPEIEKLSSVNKIFTNDDLNFIYLLDKNNGAIAKLDKNGKLSKILTNEKLTKAKTFYINEKNNHIYFITNDNSVFSIQQ